MKKQNRDPLQKSLEEMKGYFATQLVILTTSSMRHTVITGTPERSIPIAHIVQEFARSVTALESTMGKAEFYHWLDRFLHASSHEKEKMWANKGEW